MFNIIKSAAVLGIVLTLIIGTGPAWAQTSCSSDEWRRVESMFRNSASTVAAEVVLLRTNESATLDKCEAYSDGYRVHGRFHFTGALNGESFWMDASACFRRSGAQCDFQLTKANANLLENAFIKRLIIATVEAANGRR